jgi:hypothetical protein
MANKMNQNEMLQLSFSVVLVLLTLWVGTTNHKKIARIGNQITSGYVNTVLILLIIVLTLTEDLQIGFILALLYLILLVRFNKKEHFESGPSPLKCDTYGDKKKNTGTAFYPLHAQ